MKNIVVAGAGAAGWLAALHAKSLFNDDSNIEVTVVYDDKIPIIGVGESTTPGFLEFLEKYIKIPVWEILKYCEGTFKSGIKFKNWKGDGSYYYHTFTHSRIDDCCAALSCGLRADDIDRAAQLSEANKVPIKNNNVEINEDVYLNTNLALHFNAKLMAEYLQKVGKERGIKVVTGKIEDAVLDDSGFVSEIVLDTKQRIKTDFIYDCTGFSRFFVDKIFHSPMEYYDKELTTKRAMPFFLDKTDPTPPYTEAIAMKYGWMWKIPVGERYGCGYCFDSDFVSDEDAYKEICEVTGQKPEVRKKINFKPGYHTKPLNKNTLAIGLSHGFLEPLEATSLMISVEMIHMLFQLTPNIFNKKSWIGNDVFEKDFNKLVQDFVHGCVDFVKVHYLTPRNDTEFWKKGRDNISKRLEKRLKGVSDFDITKPNFIMDSSSGNISFQMRNYIQCMSGVDMIDKDMIKRNTREHLYSEVHNNAKKYKYITELSKNNDDAINDFISKKAAMSSGFRV